MSSLHHSYFGEISGERFGETLETLFPFIRLCVLAPRALSSGRKVGPGRWRMLAASPLRPVTLSSQKRLGSPNPHVSSSARVSSSRPSEPQVPPLPSNPPPPPKGWRPRKSGFWLWVAHASREGSGGRPCPAGCSPGTFRGGMGPSRLIIWFPRASEDAGTHSFHSLRSVNERGLGGGCQARGGPGGLPPPPAPPAPRAEPPHKCCDSHGPAGSAARGPSTRGPGDAADTEGFVDKLTSALPL